MTSSDHPDAKRQLEGEGLDGWQPIETAPKDGVGYFMAWCSRSRHPWIVWFSAAGQAIYPPRKTYTHWQPLPNAPVQS